MYYDISPALSTRIYFIKLYLIMTTAWSKVESWVRRFKSCNRHGYMSDVGQQARIYLTWTNRHGYMSDVDQQARIYLTWTNRHGYMSDVRQQARIFLTWTSRHWCMSDVDQQARIYVWRGERHVRRTCTAIRKRPFQLWQYLHPATSTQIVSGKIRDKAAIESRNCYG